VIVLFVVWEQADEPAPTQGNRQRNPGNDLRIRNILWRRTSLIQRCSKPKKLWLKFGGVQAITHRNENFFAESQFNCSAGASNRRATSCNSSAMTFRYT
jgi:hypothetical protein